MLFFSLLWGSNTQCGALEPWPRNQQPIQQRPGAHIRARGLQNSPAQGCRKPLLPYTPQHLTGTYKTSHAQGCRNRFSRIHLSTWEVHINLPMPRAAESTFSELRCVIVLQLLPLIFVHGMQYPVARIVILETSEK